MGHRTKVESDYNSRLAQDPWRDELSREGRWQRAEMEMFAKFMQ